MEDAAGAGVIPRSLQLPVHAPVGVRAYRRRFVSPCTNVQVANPDEFLNIYPDTATPGAFIDPESTYLMADMTITNNNYCVDYANFGVEGAMGAIIQEWRCFNQGQITEEILEYNTVASTHNSYKAAYDEEFHMFVAQKLKIGWAEQFHRNFIKPAMCDAQGNIMYGPNPLGLGFDPLAATLNMHTNSCSGGSTISSWNMSSQATFPLGVTYSSGASGFQNSADVANAGVFNTAHALTFFGARPYLNSVSAFTSPSWPGTALLNLTPMDWPDRFTPHTWSDPVEQYVQRYGTLNKPQIMANLSNVKCFPIGCIPAVDAYGTGGYNQGLVNGVGTGGNTGTPYPGQATYVAGATNIAIKPKPGVITYRLCYRPLSGILGELASKMLATTLLAPQQFYMQIKTATTPIIMQLSSDPCRRIAGTIRDYIRNVGQRNNTSWGDTTWTVSANITETSILTDAAQRTPYAFGSTAFAIGYSPGYSIPTTMGQNIGTSYWNSIFNTDAACGRFSITNIMNPTATSIGPGGNSNIVTGLGGFALPQTCPAAPQYALTTTPWVYKTLGTPVGGGGVGGGAWFTTGAANTGANIVYANEMQVFYGTRGLWSVPQSTRIFALDFQGNSRGQNPIPPTGGDGTTYQLKNISFVGDQLILPNEATADVIAQAARGQFNVHTNSYRSYVLQVQNQVTQTIICPVKVNVAKRMLVVFQNMQQRNFNTAFYYDSNCGLNPFALVDAGPVSLTNTPISFPGYIGLNAGPVLGVGWSKPINYVATPLTNTNGVTVSGSANGGTMSVQLRIGNDFFPPQPITTMQELCVEMDKTMEGWMNADYKPALYSGVATTYNNTTAQSYFDCITGNRFTTAFIDINVCDDQTITANYDFAPLFSNFVGAAGSGSEQSIYTTAGAINGQTSAMNGLNYICPIGYRVPDCYRPPSSKFVLGFNMKSFKTSDGVTSGEWLGNQNITLNLAGTVGLSGDNQAYRAVCIIPHEVVMRYSPGGQLLWAY